MPGSLQVFLEGRLVGTLEPDARRRFSFRYAPAWLSGPRAIPLSLSLPLRPEPFEDDEARPFFANLLPEAEVRRRVARRLGISETNDFGMLEAIGGECAGAVTFLPDGSAPPSGEGAYRPLSEPELHEIVSALPERPLLAGEEGIRLSLAGAQDKLPVFLKDGQVCLPLGASPSSHILKPPIRGFAQTVENEAFCMHLAREVGLPVPSVEIRKGTDTLYLVERYDRARDREGRLVRLHQEDFCQALGVPPDIKYESEGGPGLVRISALLAEHSIRPAADRLSLLRWVVFNFLIGNADAHAKNLSLLLTPEGPRLAPFYDLLCTAAYEGLTERSAMKIGGENRPEWIQPRHWERMAEELGVKRKLLFDVMADMRSKVEAKAGSMAPGFPETPEAEAMPGRIVGIVKKRARMLSGPGG